MATAPSLRWQPTTGEFGTTQWLRRFRVPQAPRDAVRHCRRRRAARAGTHRSASRRTTTQIKTLRRRHPVRDWRARHRASPYRRSTYNYASFDAGAKYRGFSFQSEYYFRRSNQFVATGPLPLTSISTTASWRKRCTWSCQDAWGSMWRPATSSTTSSDIRGRSRRGDFYPSRTRVAPQPAPDPCREVADRLLLRLLHRRPNGDDDLPRHGHSAVTERLP